MKNQICNNLWFLCILWYYRYIVLAFPLGFLSFSVISSRQAQILCITDFYFPLKSSEVYHKFHCNRRNNRVAAGLSLQGLFANVNLPQPVIIYDWYMIRFGKPLSLHFQLKHRSLSKLMLFADISFGFLFTDPPRNSRSSKWS